MPELRPFLSSVLSLSLAVGTASISTAAAARRGARISLGAAAWAVAEETSAVLTLDGEDAAAADVLSKALRKAFAKRGLSGGQEMSLVELRLTMGCDDDEPACLAQGGETLGVDRLVYGYLRPGGGGGYQVEVRILDVGQGLVDREATMPISKADLAKDTVDETAEGIVASLLPSESGSAGVPARNDATSSTEPSDAPPPPPNAPEKSGKVWVGLQKPTPAWKWAGFGVSLGLTAAAAGALAGLNAQLQGPLRDELIEAAENSLTDSKMSNDIDPNADYDLCEEARTEPPSEPGTVKNAAVTKVCNKADGYRTGTVVAGAGLGVFALSTLVFTGLLFIHRDKPAAAAMRRRALGFGAGPTTDGGLLMSGRVDF